MQLKEIINIAYRIGCFIVTICIICFLFKQYFANEDSSIVQIKSFERTNSKSFPAITICFKSNTDGLYNNQYIVSTTGLTGKEYRDTLMGNLKIANLSDLKNISFEMATLGFQSYLTQFYIKDTDFNKLIHWKRNHSIDIVNENFPLGIYYQDPTMICYSYHTDAYPIISISSVNYYFSIPNLRSINDGKLYVFVHYRNQLVRRMRHQYKVRSFNGIDQKYSNNFLGLDVNSISIMRSRKDANQPCNEDLKDDDYEWMQNVLSLTGCFPPYWKNIDSRVKDLKECNTTEQLKNVSGYLPHGNERVTKLVLKMYHQPCEQMRVLVGSNKDEYSKKDTLQIKIRFR